MNTPSWNLLKQPQHYVPSHTHTTAAAFAARQEARRVKAQAKKAA